MLARLAQGLINLFVLLAELFLAVRFILRFFNANATNQFVNWIYTSSNILMQPFRGIFPTVVFGNHHVVDFSALFAMAIYAIAGMILIWIVSFFNPTRYTVASKK